MSLPTWLASTNPSDWERYPCATDGPHRKSWRSMPGVTGRLLAEDMEGLPHGMAAYGFARRAGEAGAGYGRVCLRAPMTDRAVSAVIGVVFMNDPRGVKA